MGAVKKTKVGYKKTKLGWIPKEWEISDFKAITKINQGLQIAISERYTAAVPNSYFYITNEFLKTGSKSTYYILNPNPNVVCKREDILMTRTGNTGQVVTNVEGAFHNNFFRIKFDKEKLLRLYLFYYLTSSSVQNTILVFAGTSTIPDLNHSDFYRIKIPLPPLPEQKKIADILSTWDKAIETTQALLQKLQLRKKGLMQQLLTGEKRLPGFSGEWEEVKLGELFSEIKSKNDGKGHEPLTISSKSGFISQRKKFDRIIAGSSLSKYIQLRKFDFSYNKGNSKTYPMGCIFLLEKFETAVVPFVYISFSAAKKVDKYFYKYWFENYGLDRQLKGIISSGARGDGLLNVSKSDFFKLIIPHPNLNEQKGIAQVFVAVDEEINQTQNYLDKLQLQKRGLMQQLLTGQKRVKV